LKSTIALDAMGGDHGPQVVVPAALDALAEHANLKLILVGDEQRVHKTLDQRGVHEHPRLSIRHASQSVDMDELPSHALRGKKDSSMRVAIDLVRNEEAGACVSAGNTGALMAIARFVLKTLPGIDRPAICAQLPSTAGHVHMLDLGANVESSAEQLRQFAIMGSVLAGVVDGLEQPRIGLLNIGAEEIKGNLCVKQAAKLLAESGINYVGFVEGDGTFKGVVDVVVCDGFIGNIALKSCEGVAQMMGQFLQEEFSRNPLTRLAGLIAMPILQTLKPRMDPREYNGASFVGLRGIVIKSHGGADRKAFLNAINVARTEIEQQLPARISASMTPILQHKEAV